MKDIKKKIIAQIAVIIKEKLTEEAVELELVYPVFANQGDWSLPCFALAKKLGKNPAEIAKLMADNWVAIPEVAEVKAAGPYFNIYLKSEKVAEFLYSNEGLLIANLGQGAAVMIEFANANTHKELHIGHLRNMVYGQAVTGLLSAVGYRALPVSYINDFGIHVAKTIWQLTHEPINETDNIARGFLLGKAYVKSVAQIGEDDQAKSEVAVVMKDVEARRGESYETWQETRQWSIDYFQSVYDKLKIKFHHHYYESELIDQGRVLVEKLLAQGILIKSQGAIVADLSDEDLGVLVIIRQDGTALYPVADLALAIEKFDSADLAQSLYVVDKRQSLYFKQLFRVLQRMGYQAPMIHLPYDFVTLPSGMMSSRSGNTILFNDLYEQCKDLLISETKQRHEDWTDSQVEETSEKLTMATLKFEMLKVGADKVITFNMAEALKFEGYTAAYLLYSCARISSLLHKAGDWVERGELVYEEMSEKNLLTLLAKYPEIVEMAALKHEPSVLTQYLFDVAQQFNDFYHQCPILSLSDEKLMVSRLLLARQSKRVISEGLACLGIEITGQM